MNVQPATNIQNYSRWIALASATCMFRSLSALFQHIAYAVRSRLRDGTRTPRWLRGGGRALIRSRRQRHANV
jgi:hypothetical protein